MKSNIELVIIQSKIYEIRGQKVMIDKDLADLYQVEVKRLNEAVKRNIKRFPSDFMFQITKEEWQDLKSQYATSSWGGSRKLPFAFTEQGQEMQDIKTYIEEVFTDYNDINEDTRTQLELINQTLAELQTQRKLSDKPRNPIGFTKSK